MKLKTPKSEAESEPESEAETDQQDEKPNLLEQIVEETPPEKLDDYFGSVLTKDNAYPTGDKIVEVIENDIILDGNNYKGTPGLWTLIIFKKPDEDLYDAVGLDIYEKVHQTDVMSSLNNSRPNSRIERT